MDKLINMLSSVEGGVVRSESEWLRMGKLVGLLVLGGDEEVVGEVKRKIKRGKNGYMFYLGDVRKEVGLETSLKGKELVKEVSKRWKELSEEEKEPYLEMARNDKERYVREMAAMNGEDGEVEATKEKKGKKEKKKKKENKVKKARARSAYMFFTKSELSAEEEAMRDEGMKFMKIRGATWKKMSDEDKAPYTKMAEDDKARVAKAHESSDIVDNTAVLNEKKEKKKGRGRPKKEEEDASSTPRDRAAYISEASSLSGDDIKVSFSDEEDLFGSDDECEETKTIVGTHEYKGVVYNLSEHDELIDPKTNKEVGVLDDGKVEMF